MADLIKKIKIKKQDGTFTDYIPIGAEAQNVSTTDGDSVQLKLNKKPYYYNSVADMKADIKLKVGDMAITLGYYEANDGGGAEYKIVSSSSNYYEDLNNNLKAELIIKDVISIKALGAKVNMESQDIKPFLLTYTTIASQHKTKLFIPYGSWYCSEFSTYQWFDIEGESYFAGGTTIYPFVANQAYIFKSYNGSGHSYFQRLAHLHFSTPSNKPLTGAALHLEKCAYATFDNLTFQNIAGSALLLRNSWEINFTNLVFRHVCPIVLGENWGVIQFATNQAGQSGSISTLYFNYLQFESIIGNYIMIEGSGNGVYNNHIGTINIESFGYSTEDTLSGATITALTSSNLPASYKSFGVIKLADGSELSGLSINTIDTNNLASCFFEYNGNTYIPDSIFYKDGDGNPNKTLNVQVNTINFVGMQKDIQLLNVRNGKDNRVTRTNQLIINNVGYSCTQYKAIFNVRSENNIICNSGIRRSTDTNEFYPIEDCIYLSDYPTRIHYMGGNTNNPSWGMLRYDELSHSKNLLTLCPCCTSNEGGYFTITATGNVLHLRVRASRQTSFEIKNDTTGELIVPRSTIYVSKDYRWYTIDLSEGANFNIGDVIRVGSGSGWEQYYDAFYFTTKTTTSA